MQYKGRVSHFFRMALGIRQCIYYNDQDCVRFVLFSSGDLHDDRHLGVIAHLFII